MGIIFYILADIYTTMLKHIYIHIHMNRGAGGKRENLEILHFYT